MGPFHWSHRGSLRLPVVGNLRMKDVRALWEDFCRCLQVDAASGQCLDSEHVIIFEMAAVGWGTQPGFTLHYKQHDLPKFIKLSRFPDLNAFLKPGSLQHAEPPLLEPVQASEPNDGPVDASPSTPVATTSPSVAVTGTFSSAPASTSEVGPVASVQTEDDHAENHNPGQLSYGSPATIPHYLKVQGNGAWAALKHTFEVVEEHTKHAAEAVATTFSNTQQCFMSTDPSNASPNSPQYLSSEQSRLTTAASSTTHTNSIATRSPQIDKSNNIDQTLRIFQIVSLILILVSLGIALFSLIHRNPRLRADFATLREERRNKRLFRHAARRQRIRNCFNRFRGIESSSTSNTSNIAARHQTDRLSRVDTNGVDWTAWNEKRLQARDDDVFGRGTMREELWAMRKAHMMVDGIVCAEEGRYRNPGSKAESEESAKPKSFAAVAEQRAMERRARSYSDSNGSEKTAPPPYEEREEIEDLEVAVGVADGLRFVSICGSVGGGGGGGRVSLASSVVDTSPRDSLADSDSEPEKE